MTRVLVPVDQDVIDAVAEESDISLGEVGRRLGLLWTELTNPEEMIDDVQ